MKDYVQHHQTVAKCGEMTGRKASVWPYLFIRLADNISIALLTVLTLFFAAVGLLLPPQNVEGARWALDAAKLCLGVLLGLCAQRRRA